MFHESSLRYVALCSVKSVLVGAHSKWYSAMYQADFQVAYVYVTRWSGDARRTDARAVDTWSAIMTRDQLAQVGGAVWSDEAGRTAAQPSAVTYAAVTTRVVGEAVRCAAAATDVGWRTCALVASDQVGASAAIETRLWRAIIYVVFTVLSCVETPTDNDEQYLPGGQRSKV